eukprot:1874627-Pleurochrysis_carterae.AAC.1
MQEQTLAKHVARFKSVQHKAHLDVQFARAPQPYVEFEEVCEVCDVLVERLQPRPFHPRCGRADDNARGFCNFA